MIPHLPFGAYGPEHAVNARPSADPAEGVGKPAAWIETSKLARLFPNEKPQRPWLFKSGDAISGTPRTPLYAPGTDPAIAKLEAELAARDADIAKAAENERDRLCEIAELAMRAAERDRDDDDFNLNLGGLVWLESYRAALARTKSPEGRAET